MSLGARVRMRPVLYPTAILVTFVLTFLVETGMSPYAAGRPLILAIAIGLLLPWLAGLVTADRDRAGVVAVILVLILLTAREPGLVALGLAALILVAVQPLLARRSRSPATPTRNLWSLASRVLTVGSVILLVAVGIKAVQLGRVETFAQDLVAEFPFRSHPTAAGPPTPGAPNMVFILLDGYPRADKLLSEFGIDNSPFIGELRARDFVVADHSRSNETSTELTLAQLFNYESADQVAARLATSAPMTRADISDGLFFRDLHRLGYETVAVAPEFEQVALRRADTFLDSGQLNEFEWTLAESTALSTVSDVLWPNLAADQRRSRMVDAFTMAEAQAKSLASSRQFVFVHVVSPHAPQVFDAAGGAIELPGFFLPYSDVFEISRFGRSEYLRRLDGGLQFVNQEAIHLVDTVVAADPGAVVVVFSDHGSGAPSRSPGAAAPYADVRTANLLAVRSPGHTGIIDDRSTLANLLPRLLHAYNGSGPADVPETIYDWTGDPATSFFFDRPD